MKGILKASVFRILFSGFNFLVGLFIAGIAGTEIFGEISLMIINASLLYLVTGFGTDQSLVWHGATKQFSIHKTFTYSFLSGLIQLILFVTMALIFFSAAGQTVLSGNDSWIHFIYELIYFSGLVLLEKYVSSLYAQQRALVCNVVLSIITFLFLLFLFLVSRHMIPVGVDPFRFFCFVVFVQGVSSQVLFHILFTVRFTSLSIQDTRSFFGFSLIVFITNFIQFFAYRADFWLINYFSGTEELGIYAQANRFAQLMWVIPNILAALLVPFLSSPGAVNREDQTTGLLRIMSVFNVLVTGVIILASWFFYSRFLPSDFFAGFTPLLIMLPGYYFFTVTLILAAYFSSQKRLWINFSGSLICFLFIIIADFLLIPKMGIRGAAFANCMAYTAATIYNLYIFLRVPGVHFTDLTRFKRKDWRLVSKLQS